MKKYISALLSAAILITGLTGCSGGTSGSSDTHDENSSDGFTPAMNADEEVIINVNGSWSNFQALEAAAVKWNEIYPNAEISYVKVDAYNSMLNRVVTGDEPPEIVMFELSSYYEEKDSIITALTDLSDIGMQLSEVSSSAVSAQTVDGKLCSLPWGVLSTGFVANTTLLDSLGLEIPETNEEFINVCRSLIDSGYTPIQGCSDGFYQQLMNNDMKYLLMQIDDTQALHDSLSAASDGCGSYFMEEFEKMLELTENGFISAEINNSIPDNYEGNILHFFEGETPFLCFSTEGFSGMKKRESKSEAFTAQPFEYEFVPLPVCTDEPVLSMGFLPGLSIVSGSKNEEWAKEFLRFICSSELNEMAAVKGVPSTAASGEPDERYSHLSKIPAERRVVPYEDTVSAIADETFAFTMQNIAEGNISDASGACDSFENRLRTFR